MAATIPLHLQYQDTNGSPLEGGYLYFGTANQNPITNPITVYWDAALTQAAAQPIRTLNGYPVRNGNIANIYSSVNYSLLVKNSNLDTVYSELTSANSFFGSIINFLSDLIDTATVTLGDALIGVKRVKTGTVGTTLHNIVEMSALNAMEFMTAAEIADVRSGSATLDIATALQAAVTAATGSVLLLPTGKIGIKTEIAVPSKIDIVGGGVCTVKALATFTGDAVFQTSTKNRATLDGVIIDCNNLSLIGVFLDTSDDCKVINCEFKNYHYGVDINGEASTANRNVVMGNTFNEAGALNLSTSVAVFLFSGAKNNHVHANTIKGEVAYAILVDGGTVSGASNPSNDNVITNNILNLTSSWGINIEGSHRNIVANNSITLAAGTYCMTCDPDNCTGNPIPQNNTFIGNTCIGGTNGMRIGGQGNSVIGGKFVSQTTSGIVVQTSAGAVTASKIKIDGVHIEGSGGTAIQLDDINNIDIVRNEIYGYDNGLLAVGGNFLTVKGNKLHGQAKEGILLNVGAGTATNYSIKGNDILNSSTGNGATYAGIKSVTSGGGSLAVSIEGNDYFDDKGTPARCFITESGTIAGLYRNNASHNASVFVYDTGLVSRSEDVQTATGGAVAPNVSLGKFLVITATSNVTVNAPTNCLKGDELTITVIQGGAAGFTTTFNAVFKGVTWSETNNGVAARQSSIKFKLSDAGSTWNQVSAQTPYI